MAGVEADSRSELTARLRAAGCVFAEEEAQLLLESTADGERLEALVRRREAGEPLEQVLGWAQFAGLRLVVEPGVFIPRHRTELLAREARARAADCPAPVVVELCCGAAPIGAVVANDLAQAELYATDVDPAAVDLARRNLPSIATVLPGDLYHPLPESLRGRIDVLVANPPYVPSDAIESLPREARLHEPRAALDGGADGLDLHRRIAAGAPGWLAPGGSLLLETSAGQAAAAVKFVAAAGLHARVVSDPELDATVVVGERDSAAPL